MMLVMGKKKTRPTMTPAQIKALRDKLGLTQAEAAARVHITQAFWSRIERGRIVPPEPVAFLIQLLRDGKI